MQIELLDKSQTFLGVLIALLGLMLYKHDGNMFYKVLEEIKSDGEQAIRNLAKAANPEAIFTDHNYQLIEAGTTSSDNSTRMSCMAQVMKIKMDFARKIIAFQPTKYTDHIGKLFNWREVFLAPMFTFIFCMLLFMVDELLRLDLNVTFSCLQFLFWFMLISFILWVFIWIRYLYDAAHISSGSQANPVGRQLIFELLRWSLLTFIILTCLTVLGLHHKLGPHLDWVIIISVCSLCIIKGLFMTRDILIHSTNGAILNYQFIIKHVTAIALASLFCAIIVKCNTEHKFGYQDWLFQCTDGQWQLKWLRPVMFAGILLNGIILPFSSPYLILFWIKRQARRESEEIQIANTEAIKEMQKGFAEYVSRKKLNQPKTPKKKS